MPSNDAQNNAPHLKQRLAVGDTDDGAQFNAWGGARVPAHVRVMHGVWAAQYADAIAEGDPGAAFSLLHRLRHQEPGVDPWWLLELAVKRVVALGDRPEPAAAPEPQPPAAAAVSSTDGGS